MKADSIVIGASYCEWDEEGRPHFIDNGNARLSIVIWIKKAGEMGLEIGEVIQVCENLAEVVSVTPNQLIARQKAFLDPVLDVKARLEVSHRFE